MTTLPRLLIMFVMLTTIAAAHDKPAIMEVDAVVTAYCPCSKCCGKYADGVTSAGKDANTRGCAVDPKMIPYGSDVVIGEKAWRADDTGGAMRQSGRKGVYHIDLRMATHAEALQWGRKRIKVTVCTPATEATK